MIRRRWTGRDIFSFYKIYLKIFHGIVIQNPLTPEEISKQLEQPLFKVRSSLRELSHAELVKEENGRYGITEKGDGT